MNQKPNPSKAADFLETTKARIVLLVLVATFVGFYLGSDSFALLPLAYVLLGTGLVCASCNSLNQYMERDVDARMHRTENRPLPAGRLSPRAVLWFGVILGLAGTVLLAVLVNPLTSLLGAISLGMYLFAYTPMKRKTPLCTLVGAIPGAAPAMMGWTAASGRLDTGAWALFAILFVWQIPHFMAIATIYREEYQAGGFPMLPVQDMRMAERQSLLYSLALLPISLAPSFLGMTGTVYLWGAAILGIVFLGAGLFRMAPKIIFLLSVLYLPLLYSLMVVDKV